jgi:hypothetical protein
LELRGEVDVAGARWSFRILAAAVLLSGSGCGGSGDGSSSPGYSSSIPTPPVTQGPFGPSQLSATLLSPTQIQLTWSDNSLNETQFQVERGTNGTSFTQIAATAPNAEQFVDSGFGSAATFWYRVRASYPAGQSSYSNVAMVTIEAANSWRTLGGNERHTGYNQAETGVPPLTASWSANLTSAGLQPVVVENGRVFVTSNMRFQDTNPVWALDAGSGGLLWSYNFGNVNAVGFPAVSGSRVYVPQNNQTPGTYLWAFDAGSGSVAWQAPMLSQWELYWSPIVVNDSVWTNGGYYGGLYGFNSMTGSELFLNTGLAQYDEWSPAYGNGKVYSFVAGVLRQHDPAAGSTEWSVTVNWNWQGWSMRTSTVITGTHALVISPPNLHAINLSTQSVQWSANATFSGTPAVAEGRVFAISAGNLLARDENGLGSLWSFAGDGQLTYPPVAANGFVYVASPSNVYAVNAATGQQAWTAAVGGWLSLAEGRLFVARPNGTLQTFTLSN